MIAYSSTTVLYVRIEILYAVYTVQYGTLYEEEEEEKVRKNLESIFY